MPPGQLGGQPVPGDPGPAPPERWCLSLMELGLGRPAAWGEAHRVPAELGASAGLSLDGEIRDLGRPEPCVGEPQGVKVLG